MHETKAVNVSAEYALRAKHLPHRVLLIPKQDGNLWQTPHRKAPSGTRTRNPVAVRLSKN